MTASFIDEKLTTSFRFHRMLNDMVYDPIVNNRLLAYGFDIKSYLELQDRVQMKIKGKSDDDLFLLQTLYVKRYFDYQNLQEDVTPESIKFNQWVQNNFPQLVAGSIEMINLINSIGRESKDQTEQILMNLIHLNGFQNHMYVHNL